MFKPFSIYFSIPTLSITDPSPQPSTASTKMTKMTTTTPSPTSLQGLTADLLLCITDHLSPEEIRNLRSTCRYLESQTFNAFAKTTYTRVFCPYSKLKIDQLTRILELAPALAANVRYIEFYQQNPPPPERRRRALLQSQSVRTAGSAAPSEGEEEDEAHGGRIRSAHRRSRRLWDPKAFLKPEPKGPIEVQGADATHILTLRSNLQTLTLAGLDTRILYCVCHPRDLAATLLRKPGPCPGPAPQSEPDQQQKPPQQQRQEQQNLTLNLTIQSLHLDDLTALLQPFTSSFNNTTTTSNGTSSYYTLTALKISNLSHIKGGKYGLESLPAILLSLKSSLR
jgi:hypothetical protein